MTRTLLLAACAWAACGPAARAEDSWARTPNEFLGRGAPTFVRGTGGDADADRRVAAQVELLRGMLFPAAEVVDDVSIDATKGPSAWPRNPVLFGGAHVNALVAAVAPALPFEAAAGRLVVGGRAFEGEEHRLIAVVPAGPGGADAPAHPTFLLYAGAGTPGVTEINAVPHGGDGVLVADRFGALLRGRWELAAGEKPKLALDAAVSRRGWAPGAGDDAEASGVTFLHLRAPDPSLDVAMAERGVEQPCRRGIEAARARLGMARVEPPIRVHLYPSAAKKREWTGRGSDGHVDVLSRTLHVRADVGHEVALERLLAHEATHLLADAWGPVATPCIGEGLAVWAAGAYGGKTLDDWAKEKPPEGLGVAKLLGPDFRRLPEPTSYPLAGLLVETLVAKVGLDKVRERFLLATAATWSDACAAAGTTADEVEKAWRARVGG